VETVAPFKEVLDEIKEAGGDAFKLCFQCGLCDVVCPWNRVRQFSMRKIIREATFGLTEIEGEDIWRCTTCGRCPDRCPRGVKQIELGVSLRRVATEYEVFPASVRSARTARASLISEGNPLQGEQKKRADWAKDLSVKTFTEGMDVLYGILGDKEKCCGESIRKTGSEDVFKSLARDNIKTFIDNGVKKIIVSSPHCYHTLKNEYPEFMVNFEVVHISQYLFELMNEGRLKLDGEYGKKVTYHDPCYMGRHNDIYDEPRDVLKKVPGLELIEMVDFRKDSLCCGGGGGRIWMDTPKGERFSDLRLEQAKEVGAEVLVTACPYCITNFEESRLNLEYDDVLEIKDIVEIVNESCLQQG